MQPTMKVSPMVALAQAGRAQKDPSTDAMLAQMDAGGEGELPPAVLEKFGGAIEALEQHAAELVEAAGAMGAGDAGAAPAIDAATAEQVLPAVVLQAVDEFLPGITPDEAEEIAMHLALDAYIGQADVAPVAGLLVALVQRNNGAANPPGAGEYVGADETFPELDGEVF